jgi:hypothetical protein
MPALNMTAVISHHFRSYRVRKHRTADCEIWRAARATSATPTFFKRIQIGEVGGSQPYVGGIGCNNPITQVLMEAELVFPGQHVACVISIGTGQAKTIEIPTPGLTEQVLPLDFLKAMQGIASDCERNAQEAAQRFRKTPNIYFRFNVEQGLQSVGLAEWEKLDTVTTHTKQYLMAAEVDGKLDAAVVAIRERRQTVPTAQIGTEAA